VKEDFIAFQRDVTTDVTRYNRAPVGRPDAVHHHTDRLILQKTLAAVAFLRSFADAGTRFLHGDDPCWVFIDDTGKACAEAVLTSLATPWISHTTDALRRSRSIIRRARLGATGWAPSWAWVTTGSWCSGAAANTAGANRSQDDIAIIAAPRNGFGFATDEAGGAIDSAIPITTDNGQIAQRGVITQSSDADFYIFNTTGGAATINATPATPSPNLDLLLEVQDASGAVLASGNPVNALNASISITLEPGTYY
jgi:hypothetical protein